MKKLLVACAVSAAAVAPAAALAATPGPSDFKNAAKYCKALKTASGSNNFASMFGTKRNAYGKCVSSTAKQRADQDARQAKAAKQSAAQACQAEKAKGKNAYGKCVSATAKERKAAADREDAAQQKDRVNAAKTCKQAKKDDGEKFKKDFGSGRSAFGKCVSRTAHAMAQQRRGEVQAAA